MHCDLVARLPVTNCTTDAKDNAGGIGTDYVIVEVITLRPLAFTTQTGESPKSTDWLENAAPHRVEVDAGRHHSNDHFVWGHLGHGNLSNMNALTGVLVRTGNSLPHLFVFLADNRRAVGGGQWNGGEFFTRCTIQDGLEDLFHPIDDSEFGGTGNSGSEGIGDSEFGGIIS